MADEEAQGGRIFFSSTGRSLVEEDEIVVLSVGVDIGSSTSHLVFSRIVLERLDSRYVVTIRETFYQSDILLTPYAAEEEIVRLQDAREVGVRFRLPTGAVAGRANVVWTDPQNRAAGLRMVTFEDRACEEALTTFLESPLAGAGS